MSTLLEILYAIGRGGMAVIDYVGGLLSIRFARDRLHCRIDLREGTIHLTSTRTIFGFGGPGPDRLKGPPDSSV